MTTRLKPKHQRLVLAIFALVAVVAAGLLAASALKDEAAYFMTPAEFAASPTAVGKSARLGGMVEKGSIVSAPDGLGIAFIATDGKASVRVTYRGIVPDLFREGSGMVADGHADETGGFVATRILAKHDARYMPPQLGAMPGETPDEIARTIEDPAR
ncbi:MAG: cytochrome c maturation protein CcmE [Sphingomonadales bacterium]|nr:cytochrome c maturation protein CcmE [Sphingomonadales bacterium]